MEDEEKRGTPQERLPHLHVLRMEACKGSFSIDTVQTASVASYDNMSEDENCRFILAFLPSICIALTVVM